MHTKSTVHTESSCTLVSQQKELLTASRELLFWDLFAALTL